MDQASGSVVAKSISLKDKELENKTFEHVMDTFPVTLMLMIFYTSALFHNKVVSTFPLSCE